MAGEVEKDDLLGEIAAAYDGLEEGASAPETPAKEAPVETADEKAERVRDEQGRFAKAEEAKEKVSRETLTLKKSPEPERPAPTPVAAEQAPTAPAPGTPAKPADEFANPPLEWKGGAKIDWKYLPAYVRAEISQDYEARHREREAYAPLEQAIAPYRDEWTRVAGSPAAAISQLGEFYKLYVENPVGLIQHIARTRGIDLGQPQGQSPQGDQPQAPDINRLIEQRISQAIAPIQQRFQQTEAQQIEQTVAEFAADPRYPYFQDVKVHMGQLMQAGMARTMPEAYDKAVRLNDAIQAQIQASKAEDAKGTQAAEAEKARRAAAASLRGSPLPNGHAGGGGAGSSASVLDDVRAAAAELSGS